MQSVSQVPRCLSARAAKQKMSVVVLDRLLVIVLVVIVFVRVVVFVMVVVI